MNDFLEDISSRRRFGMKPGLDSVRRVCEMLHNPEKQFPAIHVAGTNGKGAVCAMLDACLRETGLVIGRYTSPHLVKLNERFFLNGRPLGDDILNMAASKVKNVLSESTAPSDFTFFEALTVVAFLVYAETKVNLAILETGLGGRLDATNICSPVLTIITRIGLDHCDWLGNTVEKIAFEKAGIIKPGVPIVLGENREEIVNVVRKKARESNAPFFYVPDCTDDSMQNLNLSLKGSFNKENSLTACVALKILIKTFLKNHYFESMKDGFSKVVWPGRFHRVGRFIVDGAHNPPAAIALHDAVTDALNGEKVFLIAGFCSDKDVDETLQILKPNISRAYAIKTNNPRSLDANELVLKMQSIGIDAEEKKSLEEAISDSPEDSTVLICGSLFLAGEALVKLNAYPWENPRFDPSELLKIP